MLGGATVVSLMSFPGFLSLASFPGLTRESSSLLVERAGPAGLDPRIKSGGDDGGDVRRVTNRYSTFFVIPGLDPGIQFFVGGALRPCRSGPPDQVRG
ncbi:hypothetical protein GCM10007972_17180 [Iodidimonas muriae]|uniref:Secreted protein n=1 Tax=Iodidimonas muriae TaxID=261467 RepID=A0ABQ2LDY9_9PROT|nr:hypothetical protein GCM10007972_17180 [Iodidimonas muriae]